MQALLGRRYRELAEDECVLPPLRPTDMLRPEHFDKWGLEAARQLRRQCEREHMQSRHAAPLEAE